MIVRYQHTFYNHPTVYCVLQKKSTPFCLHRCSIWSVPYVSRDRPSNVFNVIVGFEKEQTYHRMMTHDMREDEWHCELVLLEDLKHVSSMMHMPLVVIQGDSLDVMDVSYHRPSSDK